MRIDNIHLQRIIERTQDIPLVACWSGVTRVVANAFLAVHNVAMRAFIDVEKNKGERSAHYNKYTLLLYLNIIEITRGTLQLVPIIGTIWLHHFNSSTLFNYESQIKFGLSAYDVSISYHQGQYFSAFKNTFFAVKDGVAAVGHIWYTRKKV